MDENKCACGCNTAIAPKQKYARGHDARHASALWNGLVIAWADTLAADKANKYSFGTEKRATQALRDARRHEREMAPKVAEAIATAPLGRLAWLIEKIESFKMVSPEVITAAAGARAEAVAA
jgi:hypothetical protein